MRVYVINGMHRSGTSAIACLARQLGGYLGHSDDLLPPAADNPRGFFENRHFKLLNDKVLVAMGGRWDVPPPLAPGWANAPALDPLREEASAFLGRLGAEDPDALVLKDPRASLTLPFWESVHPIRGTVMALRSPMDVTASLGARNQLPPEQAAHLWLTYTAHALQADPKALIISYSELLTDPRLAAARMMALMGLGDDVPVGIEGVIDQTLHHGGRSTDNATVVAAERLFATLRESGDNSDLVHSLLHLSATNPLTAETVAIATARHHAVVDRMTAEIERLDKCAAELGAQLTRLENRAGEEAEYVRARLAREAMLLSDAEREIARLQALAGDLRHEGSTALNHVHNQLRTAQAELTNLQKELRRTRRQRDTGLRELSELRNRRGVRAALKAAEVLRPLLPQRGPAESRNEPARPAVLEAPRNRGRQTARASDRRRRLESAVESKRSTPSAHWQLHFDPTAADQTSMVTIVVPVHDSPERVAVCLDALARNTTGPAQLLVVDDASTQEATRRVLDEWQGKIGVRLLRNDENLGFTLTVNRGMATCDTDVVILNSDTEVTPRWLESLRIAAYSSPDVGTATAVSDDAGAFSVPTVGKRNDFPGHLGTDAAGRVIARGARWRLPSAPTGNGFCMYIRRAVLQDVGLFDAQAFPIGYGEENDFCMRAARVGWRHVVADAVLVRHHKGSSFGERRERLMKEGRAVVDARHPDYTQKVREFVRSDDMMEIRALSAAALAASSPGEPDGPCVLYVLHEGRGGTPATSADLAKELSDRYDCLVLTCDTQQFVLKRMTRAGLKVIESVRLERAIRFDEHYRPDVSRILADIMVRYAVELVHIRHVVKNTLDVFDVARSLAIPYVVSFHDFYMSCPTTHLLDDRDHFCGGECTEGDGNCRIPMRWIAETAPHLKHTGVKSWRTQLSPHLAGAAALVTTSRQAREIYLRSYPQLDASRFHLIEHGRDLDRDSTDWQPPRPGGVVRILIPGNLDVHKGAEFIRAMKNADTMGRLQFHFLGQDDGQFSDLGTVHGPYQRGEFAARVRSIKPHLIGIFAIWAETYNHTLSEAWMTGVPVVTTDIGALGERTRAHGGGFLVTPDDATTALHTIFAHVDSPRRLNAAARLAPRSIRSVAQMGADYDALYTRVLNGRRAIGPPGTLTLGALALGNRRESPGSVQVRTVRPLSHPALAGDLSFRMLDADDLDDANTWGAVDAVLVQRTVLPPRKVPDLIRLSRKHQKPLIVEIDDLLFDSDYLPEGDDWAEHVPPLRSLMAEAALVTTSTDVIAAHAAQIAPKVAIIPNHLDERLWFGTDYAPTEVGRQKPVRLLYVGSKTHSADLELVRPALDLVRDELGVDVILDVVGGLTEDANWFNRIPIPVSTYPGFARWLASVAPGHAVGVAPLAASRFNSAKSDLKWLEYTGMGLPGIYSRRSPYEGSVTDGQTGLLAGDTAQEWATAIRQLIGDPAHARRIVNNARWEIRRSRILDRRVRERLNLYRAAIAERGIT